MSKQMLKPCPFCGSSDIDAAFAKWGDGAVSPGCMSCGATANTQSDWNDRASPQSSADSAAALRLLAAEDERQSKLHELLETIREQIRLEAAPEHRPEGLFKNIQDAVYAMRGRTRLMDDAAITHVLNVPQTAREQKDDPASTFTDQQWHDALMGAPERSGWRPIETAPMDTDVLMAWFYEGQWKFTSGWAGSTDAGYLHSQATHWQPLPTPPVTRSQAGSVK